MLLDNDFDDYQKVKEPKDMDSGMIDNIQSLLVDLCKKISNFQYTECIAFLKSRQIGDILNFLRVQNRNEESYYMTNFVKILLKLPDIYNKYYSLDRNSLKEHINSISDLFKTKNKNLQNSSNSFNSNNKKSCLDYIIKHIVCIRYLLEMMLNFIEILNKLHEIYKNFNENTLITYNNNNFNCYNLSASFYTVNNNTNSNTNANEVYLDDIYKEIILDLEDLLLRCKKIISDHNDLEYLKNTFYPLLTLIKDNISALKCLLKSFMAFMHLDPISAISNSFSAFKSIETLKNNYKQVIVNKNIHGNNSNQNNINEVKIFDFKLYKFFKEFYLENAYKLNTLFGTYFNNKKFQLIENLQSFESFQKFEYFNNYNIINNNKIDNIFDENTINNYENRNLSMSSNLQNSQEYDTNNNINNKNYFSDYVKKCFDENIDILYFILFFEKRRFFNNFNFDNKDTIILTDLLSSGKIFIESDEDISMVSIFHTNSAESNKSILSEVSNCFKSNSEFKNSNSCKLKLNNFTQMLVLNAISNYFFIAVKIKDKNINAEINTINDICKDLRIKFANMHVLKTAFN